MSTTPTFTALVLLAVGYNISFANLVLVTTSHVRAKYTLKVHPALLIVLLPTSLPHEPSLFLPSPPLSVVLPFDPPGSIIEQKG